MHNATVQQPLAAMSPDWNPTIVMLQTEAWFVSKYNVIPFHRPCPSFLALLVAQTPLVSSHKRSNGRLVDFPLFCKRRRMNIWAVGSLVVRASDSRLEGLGSMPDATKYLRAYTEYVLVKSLGPKTCELSQGTGEYFPLLLFHAEIVEVEIGGVTIYRPFEEFRRAKSHCHLYGAQGQRQA
ncbi:hypothetical protein TNCV_1192051 [Trichonephila clavipes]|nr:hypothetical protein TNCV_1192051 [Trichonephila clavipes]